MNHPEPDRSPGPLPDHLQTVSLTRTTARVEDRVIIGGVPMRIVDVVRTHTGVRLDLEEGERLWLTTRTRLTAFREADIDPFGSRAR
ncbi:hypothetical protein FNQ90_03510 [Streptomyces alkaliphilus]|uniref:Uncharacterized protein n=1 Tax=Streptomyces alkaliphilus TaxID=1472722 RepID=A0A7W3TAD4_9ACTN|nr:hypothetical protein [Streptomyces alkaliphilus]MBB0243201.1 hypothetical protein [Streptomyces alkaliphilus]